MKRYWTAFVLVILFAWTGRAATGDCQGLGGGAADGFVKNRIIVRPRDPAQFLEHLNENKLKNLPKGKVTVRQIGTTGAFVIDSKKLTADDLATRIRALNIAEYEERDPVFKAHSVEPNDPEFVNMTNGMWGLRRTQAPDAWRFGVGTADTVVAVVDSGIEQTHSDLACNLWKADSPFTFQRPDQTVPATVDCPAGSIGYDAIDKTCTPRLRTGHGTQVSGIIGACGNNGKGMTGVNWNVQLMSVTFLDGSDSGCGSRAAEALEFVRTMKANKIADVRVVNLSWGGDVESKEVEKQLQKLAMANVVIVASAGNTGTDNDTKKTYPASYSSVDTLISVAATQQTGDRLNPNSNTGKQSVHIAAPGSYILSTDEGDMFHSNLGGTSYAAAFVTGAVALLSSQCPGLSALELKALILCNADEIEGLKPFVMKGHFLNVRKAAEAGAAAASCTKVKPPPRP